MVGTILHLRKWVNEFDFVFYVRTGERKETWEDVGYNSRRNLDCRTVILSGGIKFRRNVKQI